MDFTPYRSSPNPNAGPGGALAKPITEEILELMVPDHYALSQNYPNPFNPTTTIGFQLPQTSQVTIAIFNMRGQLIRTLSNEYFPAGYHSTNWNGRDDEGQPVASGIYIYKLVVCSNGKEIFS